MRTGAGSPWSGYDVAVVPSRQAHGMRGAAAEPGAVIFVEPETREGRILADTHPPGDIGAVERAAVAEAIGELRAACAGRRGREPVVAAARRVVQALARDQEPSVVSDPRLLRAVAYINANLARPLSLAEVAAVVHLSPGRYRHLFAAQTGTGLRQYILWRRFVSVWEHSMRGESLSTAAHAAGFADSAHLTRACRRMMGIPPSALDVSAVGIPVE